MGRAATDLLNAVPESVERRKKLVKRHWTFVVKICQCSALRRMCPGENANAALFIEVNPRKRGNLGSGPQEAKNRRDHGGNKRRPRVVRRSEQEI